MKCESIPEFSLIMKNLPLKVVYIYLTFLPIFLLINTKILTKWQNNGRAITEILPSFNEC